MPLGVGSRVARSKWICRKCRHLNYRTASRKCQGCGLLTKPKRRTPAHARTLRDDSYELYCEVAETLHAVTDESCCACRRPRSQERRHDRDHDHLTGKPRGLLCVRHNKMLDSRTNPAELRALADYLERAARFDEFFEQREAA